MVPDRLLSHRRGCLVLSVARMMDREEVKAAAVLIGVSALEERLAVTLDKFIERDGFDHLAAGLSLSEVEN